MVKTPASGTRQDSWACACALAAAAWDGGLACLINPPIGRPAMHGFAFTMICCDRLELGELSCTATSRSCTTARMR